MKKVILNIILAILIVLLLIVIILISIKYGKNQVKENELQTVVSEIKNKIEEVKKSNIEEHHKKIQFEYKGYNVVGIIKIPSINVEYPIIDTTNEQTMKQSITKFWGNNVNDMGNFCMAGHNYYDGTMFGKTKQLNTNDIIEMTDLTGNTIKYKVFKKYTVDPNDTECVNSIKENTREITLITCTNGRSNRLIIKAREIIEI